MQSSYRPLATLCAAAYLFIWSAPNTAFAGPASASGDTTHAVSPSSRTLIIPGPLDAFLRLAGVSREAPREDILPLLSHQIILEGYSGQRHALYPTEYLILLRRYVEEARELRALAGPDGILRVSGCQNAQHLLDVIGYKLGQPCGPSATLETDDSRRAFTTVDSGFPIVDLESALRSGKPFVYSFTNTALPVILGGEAWLDADGDRTHQDLLDALLGNPALARLYWALAHIDDETRAALRDSPGLRRLLPLAPEVDFYGQQLRIRSGRVLVPGGAQAESAWQSLVGVSPRSPGEFVIALFSKDNGWIAAYFDALARISGPPQAYLADSHHLIRFYDALRGHDTSPGSAHGVFRPDPGLLLLMTRLLLDSNRRPHVPGNLDVWTEVLHERGDSNLIRERTKRGGQVESPEELWELLLRLSRDDNPKGVVQAYLSLCEIDRARATASPLRPPTALLLAKNFAKYKDHYLAFAEFPALDDDSLDLFINIAESADSIPDPELRGEARGIIQAQIGLWQILARQDEIAAADENHSWQASLRPFSNIHSFPELYDATRTSLAELMHAARGNAHISQDEVIETIAGPRPSTPQAAQIRQILANKIRLVLEAQRLVSLDTLLTLGDRLPLVAEGKAPADSLLPFAQELREFEMPKPIFSNGEKITWSTAHLGDTHTRAEMDTDIDVDLRAPASARNLANARGRLVPFLRDFLTGLNYAYYAPPGALMLHNNPLFVRRHDFSGDLVRGSEFPWSTPRLVGRGETTSGGVRLSGGLPCLPYVLAEVEQEFMVPNHIQSLIWEDLVPSLMTSSVLPRWWGVTPRELHAVALYQEFGEELVRSAGGDPGLRDKVLEAFSTRLLSLRLYQLETALTSGRGEDFAGRMTPAESFYLGVEFERRYPGEMMKWGMAGKELQALVLADPQEVNERKLAADFGVPHPTLAKTMAREFLNLRPFPTYFGYSSRLLAESWESNNLYWARLADEKGIPPAELHQLIPALTHRMSENLFATDLDDWPALGRALKATGNEFLDGKLESSPVLSALSQE